MNPLPSPILANISLCCMSCVSPIRSIDCAGPYPRRAAFAKCGSAVAVEQAVDERAQRRRLVPAIGIIKIEPGERGREMFEHAHQLPLADKSADLVVRRIGDAQPLDRTL